MTNPVHLLLNISAFHASKLVTMHIFNFSLLSHSNSISVSISIYGVQRPVKRGYSEQSRTV